MVDLIKSRPTPWKGSPDDLFKIDGVDGSGGKETLRTALWAELSKTGRRRQARIIETRCMGICPKNAVTAINASKTERILTIAKPTPATEALSWLMDDELSSPPEKVAYHKPRLLQGDLVEALRGLGPRRVCGALAALGRESVSAPQGWTEKSLRRSGAPPLLPTQIQI